MLHTRGVLPELKLKLLMHTIIAELSLCLHLLIGMSGSTQEESFLEAQSFKEAVLCE
jgi:hypothetical protein